MVKVSVTMILYTHDTIYVWLESQKKRRKDRKIGKDIMAKFFLNLVKHNQLIVPRKISTIDQDKYEENYNWEHCSQNAKINDKENILKASWKEEKSKYI